MAQASFRWRAAAAAVVVSGIFAAIALLVFGQRDRSRTDAELARLARYGLSIAPPPNQWAMFKIVLGEQEAKSGDRKVEYLYRSFTNSDTPQEFASEQWPKSLRPEQVRGSQQPMPAASEETRFPPTSGPSFTHPVFQTINTDNSKWRVIAMSNSEAELLLAVDPDFEATRFSDIVPFFLLGAPPLFFLILFMNRRYAAGAPDQLIEEIAAALETFDADAGSRKIPVSRFVGVQSRKLAVVLNRLLENLKTSFDASHRFASDASHELNTPIAVIMGKLEAAVQRDDMDEQTRALLGDLLEQALQLKSITETLLLLTRSDNGRLRIRSEKINLTQTLNDLVEDMRVLAPQLAITLSMPPQDVVMEADPALLQRVLHNLGSNAVKYSRKDGEVELKLKASEQEIWLRVSNTGKGIPARDRTHIFERFYRGDASRSRSTGGVGLGLSLAREIARAHGGDIQLHESDPDGWTTFLLRLPTHGSGKPRETGGGPPA